MLMPKKVKYLKMQRGRRKGKAWRGHELAFGDYGLKALEPCWISSRQIEAARESKKHSILEKVLKESLASEQTVEVVTGQPSLVQFLVANPFPEEEVFQVVMAGDEGELRLVHIEAKGWLRRFFRFDFKLVMSRLHPAVRGRS